MKGNALRVLNPVLSSQENLDDTNGPSSAGEDGTSTVLAGAVHESVVAAAATEGNEIQATEGLEKKFNGSLANTSDANHTTFIQPLEDTQEKTGVVQEKQTENKTVDSSASGEAMLTGSVEMEINAAEPVVNVSKLTPQVSVKPRKRSTNQKEPEVPLVVQESSRSSTQTTEKEVQNVHAVCEDVSAEPRRTKGPETPSVMHGSSTATTTQTMSMAEELSKKVKDLHSSPSKKPSSKPNERINASKGSETPPAKQEASMAPILATSMAEELSKKVKDVQTGPSKKVSTKQKDRSNTRKRSETSPSARQEKSIDKPHTTILAKEQSKKTKDVCHPNKEASKPGRNPKSCTRDEDKITYHDTVVALESVLQSIEMQCREMEKSKQAQVNPSIHASDPSPISPTLPVKTTGSKGQMSMSTTAPHPVTSPVDTTTGKDSRATNMSFSMLGGAVYENASDHPSPKPADGTKQLVCTNNTTPTGKIPLQPLSGKWEGLPTENNGKVTLEPLNKTSTVPNQRPDNTVEDVLYDTLEPLNEGQYKQSVGSTNKGTDVVYNTLEPPGTDLSAKDVRIRVIDIRNIAREPAPMLEPKLGAAKSCDELNSLHYAVSKPYQAGQPIPSQQEVTQGTGKMVGSRNPRTLGSSMSDTALQGKPSHQKENLAKMAALQPPYRLPEQKTPEDSKNLEPIYTQPVKVRTMSGPKMKLSSPSNQEAGLAESLEHVYNTLEPSPDYSSTRKHPACGEGNVGDTKKLSIGKAKTNTTSVPVYAKPILKHKILKKVTTTTTQPCEPLVSTEHIYNTLEPPPPAATDNEKMNATESDHEYAILEPPAAATTQT